MTPRVAIVTGAARGIGAATVAALAGAGWRIGAIDRCQPIDGLDYPMASRAELDAVASAAAEPTMAIEADVADTAAMYEAVEATVDAFGRLDAVVCAAGVVAGGMPAWEIDDAQWNAVMNTDLTGVFVTVRAATAHLLESDAGRVVTVASAAGSLGLPTMAAYAAAKHGVIGFTRSLAADLAGHPVTANAVCPGSTDTEGLAASARIYGLDSATEFARHQQPLGRLIEPAEVAAAIAWLCSEAASAVTGAVIAVDGGMTATP